MSVREFSIKVPQEVLDDLKRRLSQTRWPTESGDSGWSRGASLAYMKELAEYWRDSYDWRREERSLNAFPQFVADIGGDSIHFIHVKAKSGVTGKTRAILLSHGWPDSFYRWYKVIPMLTDPERFGGKAEDAFDVVVPSLPGFVFSGAPAPWQANTDHSAGLFHKLMTELGYERYFAAGGDFGSQVTRLLALRHPEAIAAIHLSDLGFSGDPVFPDMSDPSPEEQTYLGGNDGWFYQEGAYAMIQGTKPLATAYAFSDSPIALASWIVDKFHAWSDCGENIESRFSNDELITSVMLYWVTGTAESSLRFYSENDYRSLLEPGQKIAVPTAFVRFPKDLGGTPPRSIGERSLDIRRWTPMPRGGHFAALEEPELLVSDMREFFRDFRG